MVLKYCCIVFHEGKKSFRRQEKTLQMTENVIYALLSVL